MSRKGHDAPPADMEGRLVRSDPIQGFAQAFVDRHPRDPGPDTPTVLLLHGWPGDSGDYRQVLPLLDDRLRVVVPEMRGFGDSDRHLMDPDRYYGPDAQADAVVAVLDQLGVGSVVAAGYDLGSRLAQTLAMRHGDRVRALAVCPPLPGAGQRILQPETVGKFWYQFFHRSPLSIELLDGKREAVDAYLRYLWSTWSAPGFSVDEGALTATVDRLSRPGAFEASTNWYRAGEGWAVASQKQQVPESAHRSTTPLEVLWPDSDPLLPIAWSDRLTDFFTDVSVRIAKGTGHFVPVESPQAFADCVHRAVARVS